MKKVCKWGLAFSVVGSLIYFSPTFSGFQQVDTETGWDELIGTWESMPNSFQKETAILEIRMGGVTYKNFPSLLEFERRAGIEDPKVQTINGRSGIGIQGMPRGWGIIIKDNWLRIVSRRGKLYFQQHGSVYSNASIEYRKVK